MRATTADAYKLIHEGALALSKVERNGIRIDAKYVERQIKYVESESAELEEAIWKTDLGRGWKKAATIKHSKASLSKDDQLRVALYRVMKRSADALTDGGNESVNAETLRRFVGDVEGMEQFLRWRKLKKTGGTFLKSLQRETRGGIVHPVFNTHLVRTYRSSSDSPNFQNNPKRDKEAQELVRRAFIPRPGRRLLEVDFGAIEVRVPCFYHSDPNLMAYVSDPAKDMHRDMAMENYKLPENEMTKAIRHSGKNECVFPWFYGDWPGSTGLAMWETSKKEKIQSGKRLRRHMKEEGIGSVDAFLEHHSAVYDDFWGKRFPVYAKWREDVWESYQRTGYVEMLTGFRCGDIAIRNEVINRPIQGTAFHLLLWSLIRLQKAIEDMGLETLIIGQIHDSIVLDVPKKEVAVVAKLCRSIMTKRIRRHWKWINVPLEVEIEASEIDGSWFEMTKLKEVA